MWHKQLLANKARLLTIPMTGTKALTALALFPIGSRYEKNSQSGLSHFIEHMLFKGTPTRPTTLDLSRELDRVGAEYNAYTSRDHTGYYIKVNAEKTELALDLLSDMIWNSKFEAAEIEKEKGVIVEELNMYQDNPTMYLDQLFEETMFGKHSLGQDIGGRPETVKKFHRRELWDFYQSFYQPSNLVLILAGQISPATIKLARKYFGSPTGKSSRLVFSRFNPQTLAGVKTRVKFKETDQAHLALGFPAFSYDDPRSISLALLNLILGGTMSSRLFIEVRERRGLAYAIQSGVNHYQEVGNLAIEAGLDKTRLVESVQVILAELEKLKKDGVTGDELKWAKENFKGRFVLSCENSNFQADWYGKQALLMKEIETPEQKLKKLRAVSVGDIQKVAQQVFDRRKLKMAIIGPFKNEGELKKML